MRDRVRALAHDDYLRLLRIARAYGRVIDREAGDLLHDAIVRAIRSRTCATGVSAVGFLAGVMRSLVSDHLRSAETRAKVAGLWHDPDLVDQLVSGPREDVEDAILAEIDRGQALGELARAFERDPALGALADAIAQGERGREIRDRFGIDARQLATLRRRLARLLGNLAADLDEGEGRHDR